MKRNFAINSLIVAIVFGMVFIPALSTAVPYTIIIQLDNDNSVTNASTIVQRSVPGSKVIRYGSFRYHLIAHRVITPTVWIGHGDENGITSKQKSISWTDFSADVANTPANDIILACHSNELLKQTTLTTNDVFTFKGEIDSVLGALITGFLLTQSERILNQAINHVESLINQDVQFNPLAFAVGDIGGGGDPDPDPDPEPDIDCPTTYQNAQSDYSYVFAYLSGVELAYHILMLVMLLFDLAVGYACAKSGMTFIQSAVIEFWIVGLPALITSLAFHADGQMTDDQLVEDIFGAFDDALSCFLGAWNDMNAGEKAAFVLMLVGAGAVLTAEILLDIFCGGAGTGIRTAASIALILVFIVGFAQDCSDTDRVVG